MKVGDPDGFGRFGTLDRDEDSVVCHECGRHFRMLVQHLRQAHAMSTSEYRERHGLPATLPLTCLGTSELIADRSRARIGTDQWLRFEEGRTRTLPASQEAATRASAQNPAPSTTEQRRADARERFSGIRETWRADQWRTTFTEVVQFHARTGRWPMRGTAVPRGSVESKLGTWLTNQRGLSRRGRQPQWKLQALRDAGVDLNPGQGARQRRTS